MDKKELKFYDAPAMDVVVLKLQGVLCASVEDPEEIEGTDQKDFGGGNKGLFD